jgi:hypothetical protein
MEKKLAKEISALLHTTPQASFETHKNSSETHMGSICRRFEKYVLGVWTSMQPVNLPTPHHPTYTPNWYQWD